MLSSHPLLYHPASSRAQPNPPNPDEKDWSLERQLADLGAQGSQTGGRFKGCLFARPQLLERRSCPPPRAKSKPYLSWGGPGSHRRIPTWLERFSGHERRLPGGRTRCPPEPKRERRAQDPKVRTRHTRTHEYGAAERKPHGTGMKVQGHSDRGQKS